MTEMDCKFSVKFLQGIHIFLLRNDKCYVILYLIGIFCMRVESTVV